MFGDIWGHFPGRGGTWAWPYSNVLIFCYILSNLASFAFFQLLWLKSELIDYLSVLTWLWRTVRVIENHIIVSAYRYFISAFIFNVFQRSLEYEGLRMFQYKNVLMMVDYHWTILSECFSCFPSYRNCCVRFILIIKKLVLPWFSSAVFALSIRWDGTGQYWINAVLYSFL